MNPAESRDPQHGAVFAPGIEGEFARASLLAMLDSQMEAAPRALAKTRDINPMVLSFLADQGGPATRRAVAAHSSTPPDTNLRLARDADWQVREELARKVSRQLPNLDASVSRAVRDATFRVLERLARDPAAIVRSVLAREIKHLCTVPRHIVQIFACDDDESVFGPVLQGSPLLSDADLMRIIATEDARGALKFIARRRPLHPNLIDAIVFRLEPESLSALLENPDAPVRSEALEHIADNADAVVSCLDSLAARKELSAQATRKIARVAGRRVLERLLSGRTHDPETQAVLEHELRARAHEPVARVDDSRDPSQLVLAAREAGTLDDAFIQSAIELGDLDTIVAALVELGGTPGRIVRRILFSGSSKSVASLVRRAGLSMRTAYRILAMMAKHESGALAHEHARAIRKARDRQTGRRLRLLGLRAHRAG